MFSKPIDQVIETHIYPYPGPHFSVDLNFRRPSLTLFELRCRLEKFAVLGECP